MFALALMPLVHACGAPDAGTGARSTDRGRVPLYEATTTVLEDQTHRPMLCLAGVLTSLPPHCGNVPITNWEWDDVEGEDRLGRTVWGDYHVVGTFDGTSFTVTEVRSPQVQPAGDLEEDEDNLCPEPKDGWNVPDPSRTSLRHEDATVAKASSKPDFAGVWVDEESAYWTVLSLAFTGHLDRHEREIRENWGGPLCLVRHKRTMKELMRIESELLGKVGEELGIQHLHSGVDEIANVLDLEVVLLHDSTLEALDARYGEGTVRATSALRRVD